jgi:hypothetical protein
MPKRPADDQPDTDLSHGWGGRPLIATLDISRLTPRRLEIEPSPAHGLGSLRVGGPTLRLCRRWLGLLHRGAEIAATAMQELVVAMRGCLVCLSTGGGWSTIPARQSTG